MYRLRALMAATAIVVCIAAPAGATTVTWTGLLELELGAQGTGAGLTLPVFGSGTALVNNSAGGALTKITIPQGAFQTVLSVPIYNQNPIVNLALDVANAAIPLAAGVACTNFGHSAVGQGGMFLPAGTGPGAHGIFCIDGPNSIYGTGGLIGGSFVGILGSPGAPFANLVVPLTQIGSGSLAVTSNVTLGLGIAGAGMGWLTGTGQVRYVTTTPGGTLTVTTTLSEAGFFSASGTTAMIKLVSPTSIQVAGAGGLPLPSFARIMLTVSGLPEPSSVLLGAAAFLTAGLLAWRARR